MNHKDFTINKVPHFLHQISLKACLPWSLLLDSQWLLYITDMVGLESKCLNRIFYNWAGVRNVHPPYKYPFKLGVGEFVYVSGCIFRGRGFTTPHRQKYNIIVLNTTTIRARGPIAAINNTIHVSKLQYWPFMMVCSLHLITSPGPCFTQANTWLKLSWW